MSKKIDVLEVLRALEQILAPGQVTEIRALDATTKTYRRPHTESGYFDDREKLAKSLGAIEAAAGIYFVPNVIDPSLLARASNRTLACEKKTPTTADHDILRRRWLLVDCDPIRPAGICSTDKEHGLALARAETIAFTMDLEGWPAPIVADSGNGAHLLWRVDEPRDDGGLIQRCLESLAVRFDDAEIKIDRKVFNPARIWKLYGTWACKGDDVPDRPHRMSRIISLPEGGARVIDRALLVGLGGDVKPVLPENRRPTEMTSFDVIGFISRHNLPVGDPKPYKDGQRWEFETCPWNEDHKGSAFLIQFGNGAISAGCHHDSCSAHDWGDLRAKYEPRPHHDNGRTKATRQRRNNDKNLALDSRPADLGDQALREAKRLVVVSDDADASILTFLPDAPVDSKHIVPDGWKVQDEGIGRSCVLRYAGGEDGRPNWKPVCSRPVVIQSWIDNQTTGLKGLRIAWKAHGKWRSLVVSREQVADSGSIIHALAPRGFPVNSSNKGDLVKYLADYESINVDIMDIEAASEQMGWQKEGGFLCGRQQIGTNVTFVGADEGEEQMANAVQSAGSIDGWFTAIHLVVGRPLVELSLYASLATPLLEILKVSNFAIDWAHKTSSGKTTTLRVAASVWGCPDERDPRSFISTWDSTAVWLERAAAARNHLPLLVDDTKRAAVFQGQSVVPKIIYEIANGQGRGRGSLKGARSTRYWRTILMSTGESRAVDTSKDGGTASRMISVWGLCFGGESIEIANTIHALDAGLRDNHGHAGPAFVEWLLKNQAEWPTWREQLSVLSEEIRESARHICGIAVAARVGGYLALLELTCRLAHQALLFPWKTTWSVKEILPTLIEGAIEADRAAEARQHALEWAYRNKGLFCGPSEEPKTPPGGWIGRWDIAWIGFFKNRLIEELSRAGYDSRSAIRQWYERGLLVCSDGRKTLQVRADGNMVRMIAIVPGEIDQFTKKPELTSETTHTGPDSTTQLTKIHSLTGQQHIPLHTKENTITALHDQPDSTRICYGTGETGYIGELDVVDDDDKDVPF